MWTTIVEIIGLTLVAAGIALVFVPAALIFAGAALVAVGVFGARVAVEPKVRR